MRHDCPNVAEGATTTCWSALDMPALAGLDHCRIFAGCLYSVGVQMSSERCTYLGVCVADIFFFSSVQVLTRAQHSKPRKNTTSTTSTGYTLSLIHTSTALGRDSCFGSAGPSLYIKTPLNCGHPKITSTCSRCRRPEKSATSTGAAAANAHVPTGYPFANHRWCITTWH